MNSVIGKGIFTKNYKATNAKMWSQNMKEIKDEFGYSKSGKVVNEKMAGFGVGNMDIESKIQDFEFNFGPMDLVSKHVRRVSSDFKSKVYS